MTTTIDLLVAHIKRSPSPLLAIDSKFAVKLVLIDGPAGAGKTTLATQLSQRLGADTIHMDDLYEGWAGLNDQLTHRLDAWISTPLMAGLSPRYLRYDWHQHRYTQWETTTATEVLIVEGVGSGQPVLSELASTTIWVQASPQVCRGRGLARDGQGSAASWDTFVATQIEHFDRYGTESRAHLRLDSSDGLKLLHSLKPRS